MKQTVIDLGNPVLLQEIIINILIRLPIKSLIRFQCGCKHWKNLFKTPSFIAEHLHHSAHQNSSLLFEDKDECGRLRLRLFDPDMQVLEFKNERFIGSVRRRWIVDSCNGLLCVIGKNHSIYLWNPAIRDVRRVPKAINWFENDDFYLGFGFSPIVNDYKIVKLYVSGADDDLVNLVEVYLLSTGSWYEVEFDDLDGVAISSNGFNINGNGAIFWSGLKLGVEEDASTYSEHLNGLAIYENKLAMLSHTLSGDLESSLVELWVMEEDTGASRERWNWTIRYTSKPYLGLWLLPVTIWKNEIICDITVLPEDITKTKAEVENAEQKIVMSNLTTNEFKMYAIRRAGGLGYGFFNYAESLVAVNNIQIE
ncbi:F-box/kelch-repeat protein At3g06240-like [Neltuma alba]|uniref:F-box/kelch-repeat protein At3g06240-like n=1 Tax=Neltuma alba TaxID=207710 RepID=UPI0010A3CFA2|nr:F-box/kelch-repeat protein At3g06240-like [Prosopis alba]